MRHIVSAVALMAGLASAASAQPAGGSVWRIGLNGGLEGANRTGTQQLTFDRNLETASVTTTTALRHAPLVDASLTVRVAKGFALGVGVSSAAFRATAQVSARIPHPFFFNQPRSIDGTAPVTQTETALHLQPTFIAAFSRAEVSVFGGPTLFRIGQELITNVTYSDSYPFDTASFLSATTQRAGKYALGYNMGVDVTWTVSRHVGVGALLRYAAASCEISAGTASSSVTAGRTQAAGGLRFRL